MFLLLLMMVVCRNIVSADTVMSVTASARIGESAVLQCHNITDQTLMSVIWKIQLQNNYTCLLSRMASDDSKSNNSCNQRIKGDNLSLTIDSALISDEGNYTCEIVTGHTGTFISVTTLHVSAEPSVTLGLSGEGSPECRAIGGYPAAVISWVPQSQDINTTRAENLDGTWTVTSVYSVMCGNVTSVTCAVSHPTFMGPQEKSISVCGGETYSLWVLAIIPILLFFTGYVVYWKRSQLRKCFKMSLNTTPPQLQDGTEEDNQEFEPYAMYTQKENTIYSQASKE
ncbi:cell surface glycoprotein CD200 receptor 1-A-like isoform X2 [Pseudophryne corroboree]|uniref:cell surface glycoprotein CD200 receptor 1-A-like isoform X2 n=1 Tax=Pseudophryne corroboree TaxID=495146 RepID=UPI003081963C